MMQVTIIQRVEKMLKGRDPAHDFSHIMRVYRNAETIGRSEGTDIKALKKCQLGLSTI
jgi:HD superfamily phosphodiesterase